jgi:hypothetical protein
MTILDTAIAVLIGMIARDMINSLYYELRYRLRKKKSRHYEFLASELEENKE